MDTDNVLLIAAATVICVAITGGVYNSTKEDQAIADAIKAGATPTQLACAYNPPTESSARLALCGNYEFKGPK